MVTLYLSGIKKVFQFQSHKSWQEVNCANVLLVSLCEFNQKKQGPRKIKIQSGVKRLTKDRGCAARDKY